MMRKTRHVIAVMVVATALCADRALSPAPQPRPQSAGFARSFVSRLTSSFRNVVATGAMRPARAIESAQPFPLPIQHAADGVRVEFLPFQFRLPPPVL